MEAGPGFLNGRLGVGLPGAILAAVLTVLNMILYRRAGFPLNIASSLFAPFPLLVLILHDRRTWLVPAVVSLAALALALATGLDGAATYLLAFGLPSLFAGYGVALGMAVPRVVFFSVLGSVFVLGLVWVSAGTLAPADAALPFWATASGWSRDLFDVAGAAGSVEGEMGGTAALLYRSLGGVLMKIWPALLVVNLAVIVWMNLLLLRFAFPKLEYFTLLPAGDSWKAPGWAVWIFIAGGFLTVADHELLRQAGWNGVVLFAFVYFLQGLAVVTYLFRRKRVPSLLRLAGYALILFEHVLTAMVALVGLLDQWFDFRARFGGDAEESKAD